MVRDKQVVENKKIFKELEHEDKRLNHEMEVDRVNAVRIAEEINNKRKNERLIGARMIMDQIEHHQQVYAHSIKKQYYLLSALVILLNWL